MDDGRYKIIVSETALVEGIEAMVKAKGWTKSNVVCEAVRTHLRQNAISWEHGEFDRHQAATFRGQDRRMRQLWTDSQFRMAFSDVSAQSNYFHTPPVLPEAGDASEASTLFTQFPMRPIEKRLQLLCGNVLSLGFAVQ